MVRCADVSLQMVRLKCVAEHGLALRFHRLGKCLIVAGAKHVANRVPGKAKLRELLTYVVRATSLLSASLKITSNPITLTL